MLLLSRSTGPDMWITHPSALVIKSSPLNGNELFFFGNELVQQPLLCSLSTVNGVTIHWRTQASHLELFSSLSTSNLVTKPNQLFFQVSLQAVLS